MAGRDDSAALAALYREYGARLVRALRSRGIPESVAEDAAQDAWTILSRLGSGHLRAESPFAWLVTVAEREAWRALQRQAAPLDDAPEPLDHGADVPTLAELRARLAEGMDALAALPEHQRTALTAQAVGLTYNEVAEQTGHTYTWVNRHTTEARKALREATE